MVAYHVEGSWVVLVPVTRLTSENPYDNIASESSCTANKNIQEGG